MASLISRCVVSSVAWMWQFFDYKFFIEIDSNSELERPNGAFRILLCIFHLHSKLSFDKMCVAL